MQNLSPADELSEIRAAVARLKAREISLCASIEQAAQSPAPTPSRPGWPIIRTAAVH
ncbi:MAG: hypothetical protein JWS10_3196 [Cypionkella sp.]|uniref:hypothetical protein n=1 Tax=Cypionkella sp. TaxID=2811411 RepID=UPI002623E5B1|nr:hypothetical protein [Cypionkella sp.]MDB5660581.1 hypothetical protein [Cypionkella sp.]MDB5666623.1 hypothetical protein [Cypionkella sp.]